MAVCGGGGSGAAATALPATDSGGDWPLQHGWPSCFLRLQQWPRQQLTPSGSQMLRKGRSGQYFGLPSSVQIEDSSSYSNLHLRAEIYEICTLSGALGLLGLLGLWAFGALFANVTQGICLSTYLKIALFERTITQCSDSLNGGGGGGVSARLSGTCQRPLQPNKVQMTPISCFLKSFSLTQSSMFAIPTSAFFLSFSYFPSFLFFLPTNATEDGDSRVGGDVANPLEFISPPTRWTIEVGLVFYSVA